MRMRRASGRVTSLALAVVMAVSGLAGCGFGTTPEIEAISRDIEGQLAKLPNVVEVEVDYENSLDLPGSVRVTFKSSGASNVEVLVDEAVRLLWQSDINPLYDIFVSIDDASQSEVMSRYLDVSSDEADLAAKYGPRPQPE